jgi:hypothetical protein
MRILLLLAVIAVAAWYLLWRGRRRSTTADPRRISRPSAAGADRSRIRLRPGPGACAPARQQAGHRIPTSEMPRLPLPGCRVQVCRCRFEEVYERRSGERRKQRDRRQTIRYDEAGGDRRKKDRRS